MGKTADMVGKVFGRLTVISLSTKRTTGNNGAMWLCKCSCGTSKTVRGDGLRCGRVVSCGCFNLELSRQKGLNNAKHGKRHSKVYKSWSDMIQRCTNENTPNYERWGGRGITVCDRWLKFENFYEDMGDPPAGMSLDRRENDGNYEPGNCRWATPKEQANNRRSNHLVAIDGVVMSASEADRLLGLNQGTTANTANYHGIDR